MSNWDYSKRFRSGQDAWPHGLSDLLADLTSAGFAPRLVAPSLAPDATSFSSELNERVFRILGVRASHLESPQLAHSMTYVQGGAAKIAAPAEWALILADAAAAQKIAGTATLLIEVKSPDAALDHALKKMATPEWFQSEKPRLSLNEQFPGVHFEAPDTCVVGPCVSIGAGTIVESGVRIGARVKIGAHSRLGSHSRIGDDCELGDRVFLKHAVSLGGQGFGFIRYPTEKITRRRLHVGQVRLGADVQLGAFVAVDRGVFEDTVIGDRSALDNIVQFAHNCELGTDGRLCSFVGLSGSTKIGSQVTIAGMVGTKGHLRIGNQVMIAGQSGVTADVADGSVVKGYPPRPIKEALKIAMLTTKLPEIYERLKKLERALVARVSEGLKP